MNKRVFKKLISVFLSTSMIFTSTGVVNVFGADTAILYEKKDIQTIAKGLTYEKSTRMYKSGWLDVYVLTMDAQENDLALDVIESVDSYGAKATVEKLAKDNGVVAAINGDFFGSGKLKSSMGQVAENGDMVAVQNYYNGSDNKYAGLFIDSSGTPFIDYVKSTIGFYGSGSVSMEMGAKNKVTDFSKPVYFDKRAISNTKNLDANFKNLTKIVVEDGKIKYISNAGETVNVPENGYIIVLSEATRQKEISKFSVGMSVSFTESEKFLFRESKKISDILVGISGGGELLRNGEIISKGLIIGENAYNPRTLVGVNKEKTKIYLVCIDGRKNGKGATHTEAATIMKEYGCYDAIHLDGGGSTTMAVQLKDTKVPTIVNVPSEGSQRAVANGLGIKVTGEAGVPSRIEPYIADSDENILFKDFGSKIYVSLYDGQLSQMSVDVGKLEFSSSLSGSWEGNVFTPTQTGSGTITVKYGNLVGSVDVTVLKGAAALRLSAEEYALGVGEKTKLNASVINKDGYSLNVDDSKVSYSVSNENVGHIENGYFVATGEGECVITGSGYDVSSKIRIYVGKKLVALNSFEAKRDFVMYYYPENSGIEGKALSDDSVKYDGSRAVRIDYKFKENMTTTQSVYASFEKKNIPFPKGVTEFEIWYKGDGSENVLKAVINYGQNKSTDVVIADNLKSTQWTKASVKLPSDVKAPIYLNKIYVSALNTTNENVSGSVYVDYLTARAAVGGGGMENTNINDYMEVNLSSLVGNYTSVTAFGNSKGIENGGKELISKMANKTRSMAFVGGYGISDTLGVPAVINQNKYTTNENEHFSFVTLSVSGGSLKSGNPDQWRYVKDYINRLSRKNVIVMMDSYLWSGISDKREVEALHDILKTASRQADKNIVVLSSVGESNYVEIKDGIRYINLAGVKSKNRQYIRFMGNDNELYYQFVDVK